MNRVFFLCLGGNEKHAAFGPGDACHDKKSSRILKKLQNWKADKLGWI
jgi:hypothetical protein